MKDIQGLTIARWSTTGPAEEPTLLLFTKRLLLPVIMMVALISNAGAATVAGVTLPDSYPVDGQSLPLNGIGLRTITIFHVRIYVAGLYLARPSHDAQQILSSSSPKVILMQFLHAGTKEQVEKEYREGEQHTCADGDCPRSEEPDFERLVAAAPGVNVGDTTAYVFTSKGVRVFANNRLIADIANPGLARHILAGFIGKHPPSEDLRSHLLGLPDG